MERLRSLARWSTNYDDPWTNDLAFEAAAAIATLHSNPSLVVACRRMLAHHPTSAPLWWLLAHVLAAADPARTARELRDRLEGDLTVERVSAGLPLLDAGQKVGVVGWGRLPERVFSERVDLDVVRISVLSAGATDASYRSRLDRQTVEIDPYDLAEHGVAIVLAPALAVTSDVALLGEGFGDLLYEAGSIPIWLVASLGTLLPQKLFIAVERAAIEIPTITERVRLERFAKVVGPRGVESPTDAVVGLSCPIPAELLKPL